MSPSVPARSNNLCWYEADEPFDRDEGSKRIQELSRWAESKVGDPVAECGGCSKSGTREIPDRSRVCRRSQGVELVSETSKTEGSTVQLLLDL